MAADGDMRRKIVLVPAIVSRPLLRGLGAEQQVQDLLEAAAHQAGEAEHFALVHGEGDVLDDPSR